MVGVGQKNGDPSPIFDKATVTTTREYKSSEGAVTESIVHRLNHLSLLINSSGIDLNIAFNESVYESAAEAANETELQSNDGNSILASLSSQSTKRRSIMPLPKTEASEIVKSALHKNTSNPKPSNTFCSYMCKDGLLDAFLALYDECCTNEKYKRDILVQDFVKKYQPYAAHLSKLRVGLSDFECVRVIGRGHFGVVQLVKELSTGNVYALKTLRKDDTLQQKHVAFFEEERDIMAKASSPWITRLQYAFQDARHLHLVMEYHPGGDLLSLMERHQSQHGSRCLPQDWVVFYMAQTTTALHHLHSMGYVHRDVKPDNLLLDRCGHVKLADFGSSCRVGGDGRVTACLPAGTPDYVAPEVLAAADGSAGYGVSCDYWSAGIVAYEMLYGDTPFASDKMVNTYSNIMLHESKLQFPATDDVSEDAVSFIKSLVCGVHRRLDYRGITQHQFFLHCDWNALDLMVPPFIPSVSAPDDSSNFDSFSDAEAFEGASLDVSSFRSDGSSMGRRVPFVGFTFVRPPLGEET
ncbi:Protein kinase domain [Trinorchestia longiramus]|nr:Protein kinase domain [Trinorchestia longiramus]